MPDKPVVFLAFANDRVRHVRYLRNLPAEARRLAGALESARQTGHCEVVVRANVTLTELFAVFQSAEYRDRVAVLHYGGHAEGYGLLLEGEGDGGVEAAHAVGLAELLGVQRGLRLVFLNGCATEPQAQGLLTAGVPAVLVTSQAIDDAVALEFAGHFYAGLGGGASLSTAYAEAKAAVITRRGAGVARGVGLYRPDAEKLPERWPWELIPKPGAEQVLNWSLPHAVGDPLFGIPAVPQGDLPEHPYRHLQPFGRTHAAVFFGRGEAIRALYERVTGPDSPPLILLYGRSGVGKSSLLEAGLLPRLEPTHTLCYRRRDPAQGLWGTLTSCLGEDLHGTQARAQWQHREAEAGKPLLIVLDQVEEVYTRPDPNHPNELADCLNALQHLLADPTARPQGKLILGFRKEWLPELEQALVERELPRSAVYLPPLDRRGLIEAIRGPTSTPRLQQRYGLTIQAGLAETIADALLIDPEAPLAPTLQILLAKLWAAARAQDSAQPHFDNALFKGPQREGLFLGDYLDQQLAAIAQHHPEAVDSGLVLDLLAYHTTARSTAEARSAEALQKAYAHCQDLPALITICQRDYLLLPTPAGGTRLGHDTLAPLIRERFEASGWPGQRARGILENRAVGWTHGRQGQPLDETDLTLVEVGIPGMRAWTAPENKLIAASRTARDRRARLRKRYWALGLIAIITVTLSAVLATWQWRVADGNRMAAERQSQLADANRLIAERQSRISFARQLAADAQVIATEYPIRALLLAADAQRRSLEADGIRLAGPETVLRSLLASPRGLPLVHDVASGKGSWAAVAFDPQGRWLATVSMGAKDNTVRLWDLEDSKAGQVVLRGHENRVHSLVFDPQGRWLATGAYDETSVRLWDLEDPKAAPVVLRGHEASVYWLAFDPKGRWLATGSYDKTVRLWGLEDLKAPTVVLRGHEREVSAVAFDPKGRWLATGSRDKTARVWDLEDPKAAPVVLRGHVDWVDSLAFDPQGRWLATGSYRTARLWDLEDPKAAPVVLRGHEARVHSLAFDPKGRWLATGSHTVQLWDLEDIEARPVVLRGTVPAFGPQGRWLATWGWKKTTVRLWDLEDLKATPVKLHGHESAVTGLDFNPQGRWLVTWSLDEKTVRMWDIKALGVRPVVLREPEDSKYKLTIDPQVRWLATWSRDDTTVRLRNLEDLKAVPVLLRGHEGGVNVLAFDPQGRWLLTGSGDETSVRLWDLEDLKTPPVVLRGHEVIVLLLAFDPQGRWLATGSGDNTVRLWDLEDPKAAPVVLRGHEEIVLDLAFDPQGRWLATGSQDNTARLWDLKDLEAAPVVLRGHERGVSALAFHPQGRWLVTGSYRTARLWDLEDPKAAPVVLRGHEDTVLDLAFDPQGRWLATGSYDETSVRLWDLEDLKTPPVVLRAHSRGVSALAFHPQGRWLATGSDGSVRLWDIEALGVRPVVLRGHEGRVYRLAFDPQGRWLATVTPDNTVSLWEFRIERLLQLACKIAGRNLTRDEWSNHTDDIPYQVTCPEHPEPFS